MVSETHLKYPLQTLSFVISQYSFFIVMVLSSFGLRYRDMDSQCGMDITNATFTIISLKKDVFVPFPREDQADTLSQRIWPTKE